MKLNLGLYWELLFSDYAVNSTVIIVQLYHAEKCMKLLPVAGFMNRKGVTKSNLHNNIESGNVDI
jgi:hypothetical protein